MGTIDDTWLGDRLEGLLGGEELEPLTDSLSSTIRWRYSDYGAILKTELEMLAQMPPAAVDRPPRPEPFTQPG